MLASQSERAIRILIVDDHALFREGIRMILEAQPDIEVVGEAEDGEQALALVEEVRPDVVIMDIAMPGIGGLEATRRIKAAHPEVRILALTMHDHKEYVLPMLGFGASGYVVKRAAASELVQAIRSVYKDESYLYPSVAKALLEEYRRRVPAGEEDGLTEREQEVLRLIAEGLTNQEIAQRLYLSVRTVETHRKNIMEKLGLHTSADLVRYAIRKGLIKP
ncbi:MAG: response regulator transcription factor [Armatimonadota bacterium]|nr:response regulator transcription factor [Armatimonadota bacterium]MDR5702261.1 response regulator transcription factor [Armatimonadota bacterium]MDR7434551.1 response regulator transcription factor [Armatimonadota bacterium]